MCIWLFKVKLVWSLASGTSVNSGKAARRAARGSGHAQSCSGWRSSPPAGSSSSLWFSAAAQWSPERSAAGRSPRTDLWSARQPCRSCAAGKIRGSRGWRLWYSECTAWYLKRLGHSYLLIMFKSTFINLLLSAVFLCCPLKGCKRFIWR